MVLFEKMGQTNKYTTRGIIKNRKQECKTEIFAWFLNCGVEYIDGSHQFHNVIRMKIVQVAST